MEDISLTVSRVCANLSIKVIHNNQTKRISEIPATLKELNEMTRRIFALDFEPKLYMINSDSKTSLDNEAQYVKLVNLSQSSIKVYVQEEKLNQVEGIIDKHLSNLEDRLRSLVINYKNNTLSSSTTEEVNLHSQCDICQVCPIMNNKYICLVCDDLTLCSNCEKEHSHPVIKIKGNDFTTKEDICNLLLNDNEDRKSFNSILLNKQKALKGVKDKLFRISPKFKVKFLMAAMCHQLQRGMPFTIKFFIINEGIHSIPPETLIYFKNTHQNKIQTKKLGELLLPKSSMEFAFEVIPGKNLEEISIEAHIYHKEFKIEYTPLKFKILVSDNCEENKDLQQSFSYPGFNPEDTVSTLPNDKKEVLAEIIRKDLSSKDILAICNILDKHNWKITPEAIEEMK